MKDNVMDKLFTILGVILRLFLPALVDLFKKPRKEYTAEQPDGSGFPDGEELRKRVQDHWGGAIVVFLVVGMFIFGGCNLVSLQESKNAPPTVIKTIYIKPGDPVRLREDIPNAKIWVRQADGSIAAGELTLSEGWDVLPPER